MDRENKSSFKKMVIKQLPKFLFGRGEYKINFDKLHFYIKPRSDHLFVLWETFYKNDYENELKDIKTIVDLGAHIGDFTIWAKDKYRPNKIISLEPTPDLFKLLKKNLKINNCSQDVRIHNEAIFEVNTKVLLKKGLTSALNSVTKSSSGEINGITLKKLIQRESLDKVDLFKMDIEGGERFVLNENNVNIFSNKIKNIIIESHDLNGNKKEDAIKYFKELGYQIEVEEIPWFFGIVRIYGKNPKIT